MLFFSPSLLMLFKRHSLDIYKKNSDQVFTIKLPREALLHLEIVNKDEFAKVVIDSLKELNLQKQQVVIALSDHVVFEKNIQATPEDLDKKISQFYHNVPLDEGKIAKKIIPMGDKQLLLAANRELYQTLIELMEEFEWKIKAVIPMIIFPPVEDNTTLSRDQVKKILGTYDSYTGTDFLQEDQIIDKTPSSAPFETENDLPKEAAASGGSVLKGLAISILCIGLIVGSLLYFGIISIPEGFLGFIQKKSPQASSIPAATSSAQLEVSEASPSSQPVEESTPSSKLHKSDVRIHVLNGSGISGQAAKIKEKLVEAGFTTVVTGNIQGTEASQSSITYAEKVDQPMRIEINNLIDALVGTSEKIIGGINEFDAIVIIGNLDQAIE